MSEEKIYEIIMGKDDRKQLKRLEAIGITATPLMIVSAENTEHMELDHLLFDAGIEFCTCAVDAVFVSPKIPCYKSSRASKKLYFKNSNARLVYEHRAIWNHWQRSYRDTQL